MIKKKITNDFKALLEIAHNISFAEYKNPQNNAFPIT